MFAFRRQKIGMGQKGGVISPCRGRAKHLQDLRKSTMSWRCHFKQLSSTKLNLRKAQEEKYLNRTVHHRNLTPWVQSHAHYTMTGIHSQSVKLSKVRPESSFYLQPTNMRSAEFTLVMGELNGVQREAALEETAAEKSWWGCKPCLGLGWSTQEDKQVYRETSRAMQGTCDSAPKKGYREWEQRQATKKELETLPGHVGVVSGKPKFTCSRSLWRASRAQRLLLHW